MDIILTFFSFSPVLVLFILAFFSVCLGLLIFKLVAFVMDILPFI